MNPEFNATPLRTPEGFRAWRIAHGLSQPQLADLLDLHGKVTISRYENGHMPISRMIELALIGLDQVLQQRQPELDLTEENALIVELMQERDCVVGVSSADLDTFRKEHDLADIMGAVAGDKRAMIRLRKACGLPAFR